MNPSGSGYFVSVSDAVRERLARLSDVAAADGRIEAFMSALRTLTERLQTEPTEFGEEMYDLHALRLTVKTGVALPLSVEFAVHPTQRVVFVRTFRYVTPGNLPPSGPHRNGTA